MTFTNGAPSNTKGGFDPAGLIQTATADGKACSQIEDGTRYQAPTEWIPAGKTASWEFAFSCPAEPGASLELTNAHRASPNTYIFQGRVP